MNNDDPQQPPEQAPSQEAVPEQTTAETPQVIESAPSEPTTAPVLPDTEVAAPTEPASAPFSPTTSETPEVPSGESTPTAGTVTPPPAPPAKPRHRKRWLGIVLVIIVVAAAAGLAYSHFHKKQQVAVTTKKEIAVIRVGVDDTFPGDFYPDAQVDTMVSEISSQVFDGLTRLVNTSQVAPDLATSWTTPTSTDWVFTLRKGVYFHDGHLMTAQLVKAALDASHDSAFWQQFGTTIKTVSVVNDNTIKITTTQPDPLLINELSNLMIFDTTSGKANNPTNGTGAYDLKPGTKLTSNGIDLVAYDRYWDGRPLTREVDYISEPSNAVSLSALKQGKVNMAVVDTPTTDQFVKANTNYQKIPVFSPVVTFLVPNVNDTASPLSKLAVRQAIYGALDPATIAKVHGDDGTPIGQLVPQEIPGYDASLVRPAIDVAKSKQEIVAAGYPNGFTMKLTYYDGPDNDAEFTEIQKELAPIGITVTKDPYTDGDALADAAFGGKTQIFSVGNATSLLDLSDVVSGLVVPANYTNPKLDSLESQAAGELDPAKRLKLLQEINSLVVQDLAVMPLYQTDSTPLIVPTSLHLATHQQTIVDDTGLYFYQVYATQ